MNNLLTSDDIIRIQKVVMIVVFQSMGKNEINFKLARRNLLREKKMHEYA